MFLKIYSYSARLATMETGIGISDSAIRNAKLNLLRSQASELHKESPSPWKKGWAMLGFPAEARDARIAVDMMKSSRETEMANLNFIFVYIIIYI